MDTNTKQTQEATTSFKRMPKGFWRLDSWVCDDQHKDRRIQMILDSDATAMAGPYFCRDLDIEIEAQEWEDFLERLEQTQIEQELLLKDFLERPGYKVEEVESLDPIRDRFIEGWDLHTDLETTLELLSTTRARIHLLRSNQTFNAATTPKEAA
jgi:hypothetical protein